MGVIVPEMGIKLPKKTSHNNKSLIDALFPSVRKKILGLLFGNPNRSFFFNELVALAKSGTGAVQRELKRLSDSGLVVVTQVANQKHYQANPDSPIYVELCSLIMKTVGLEEPLRQALEYGKEKIYLALVYGSVAKKSENASSDIDVLIVSDDMILEDLYFLLGEVEKELVRKINPILFTRVEFDQRLQENNSFLKRVLNGETIVLIGEMPDGY